MLLLFGAQIALLAGCVIFFIGCLTDYLTERKYSPPAKRITVNRFRLASVCLFLSVLMTVGAFIDASHITALLLAFVVVPVVVAMRFFLYLFEYREYHTELNKVIISGIITLVVSVACLWFPIVFVGDFFHLW